VGVPPTGHAFAVQFVNVAGESIHFDLATLCDQAGLPIEKIRSAARLRAQALRGSNAR
jgi:hypothetical protein